MLIKGLQNLYPHWARWRQTGANTHTHTSMTCRRCTSTGCRHESVRYCYFKLQVPLCRNTQTPSQKMVTQADMVRLNLSLRSAFTIAFLACCNKPVYLFGKDWRTSYRLPCCCGRNYSLSVQFWRTKIRLGFITNLNFGVLKLSKQWKQ